MSFMRIFAHGNLTRDPEFKVIPGSQTSVAQFGLASNRRYKTAAGEQKEDVCFIDCTAFGRTAEVINEHFRKGKGIIIEGRLKLEQWEDRQGGGRRSKHVVIVENFDFVGPKDQVGGEGDHKPRHQSQPAGGRPTRDEGGGRWPEKRTPETVEPPYGDEKVFEDSQIPFVWAGRSTLPL